MERRKGVLFDHLKDFYHDLDPYILTKFEALRARIKRMKGISPVKVGSRGKVLKEQMMNHFEKGTTVDVSKMVTPLHASQVPGDPACKGISGQSRAISTETKIEEPSLLLGDLTVLEEEKIYVVENKKKINDGVYEFKGVDEVASEKEESDSVEDRDKDEEESQEDENEEGAEDGIALQERPCQVSLAFSSDNDVCGLLRKGNLEQKEDTEQGNASSSSS
ncbi:hypothetical protein U1Q18_027948 [Sarracenia purpurea var. burkii]